MAGQLWRYPDAVELVPVLGADVLPCFPSLELDRVCSIDKSGSQTIMFKVFNDDILRLFCRST